MIQRNSPTRSPSHAADQIPDVVTTSAEASELKAASVRAFLLLLLGLIALSSTAIFIKFSIHEITAEATVFNRLWIATIVFASWNWGQQRWQSRRQESAEAVRETLETKTADETPSSSKRIVTLLVALALVHLIGRFLWTWSLTQTTVANGAMLANMPPLFTALGGWLFLGQRFDRRFLIGLIIAVWGAVVLGLGDWLQPKEELFGTTALIGDGAALLSSVFYAGSFLLVEKLRQRLNTSDILVWRCALGLAIAAPLVWFMDENLFPISLMGWLAVIGLAVISEVMGHGLIVYSLKYFSSAFVTIVLLLEPAPAAAVAWFLFGEFLDPLNILGFILITIGIYLAKTGQGADGSDKEQPVITVAEDLVEEASEPQVI